MSTKNDDSKSYLKSALFNALAVLFALLLAGFLMNKYKPLNPWSNFPDITIGQPDADSPTNLSIIGQRLVNISDGGSGRVVIPSTLANIDNLFDHNVSNSRVCMCGDFSCPWGNDLDVYASPPLSIKPDSDPDPDYIPKIIIFTESYEDSDGNPYNEHNIKPNPNYNFPLGQTVPAIIKVNGKEVTFYVKKNINGLQLNVPINLDNYSIPTID